jgi:hypothetical protein
MEQMRADIRLKQKQELTEWPKVFTAALVAVAAIFAAFGSVVTATLLHR